jgi:hypothetical protein
VCCWAVQCWLLWCWLLGGCADTRIRVPPLPGWPMAMRCPRTWAWVLTVAQIEWDATEVWMLVGIQAPDSPAAAELAAELQELVISAVELRADEGYDGEFFFGAKDSGAEELASSSGEDDDGDGDGDGDGEFELT